MSEINASEEPAVEPPKAQKPRMAWDQWLAHQLVRPLAHTRVTPNQITTLRLALGLGACALFAVGTAPEIMWAAGLYMLSNFVDHMDGELARLTGRTSKFGHYYDIACDAGIHIIMFICIGIGLRDSWLGEWGILLGAIAGVSVSLLFLTFQIIESRVGQRLARQPQFKGFHIEDTMYFMGPITWCGGLIVLLVAATVIGPIFLGWTAWRERAVLFGPRAAEPE